MSANMCPFCGCDPYEYVNNGVGMEAVAVTCCDLGVAYFDRREDGADTVTISYGQLDHLASIFFALRTLGANPRMPE